MLQVVLCAGFGRGGVGPVRLGSMLRYTPRRPGGLRSAVAELLRRPGREVNEVPTPCEDDLNLVKPRNEKHEEMKSARSKRRFWKGILEW